MTDDGRVHYKERVIDEYKCGRVLCSCFTSHIPFVDCPECLESIESRHEHTKEESER